MPASSDAEREDGEVRSAAGGLSLRRLRIVSLNAWGGREWAALEPWLKRLDADVFCAQEVIRAPDPQPEWLCYEDPNRRLAQRSDLFGEICRCLPRHQARFAAAARGPLTGDDGRSYVSEHGLGLWVRDDLAVSGSFDGFVFGRFRHDGWGAEPVPRALQIVRLASPDTGKTLVGANLHGIRQPGGKLDTPDRKVQCANLINGLKGFREPGEPLVVAGDFNLLPDSATFQALEAMGLANLVVQNGITDTRTSLYKKAERYADYVLASQEVEVLAFDAPAEPEVSDHRPLVLDIGI
ncbi:endonuclease/exonuclease/phosphatase family protein [Ovoidimarina sediminis]|uniref:endonuclease/exonuclease/phosphatase family protein n=1 Tax=Ovoidimarina sediminis TaxID=3079856 RepID=UPI00290C8364|nr:endonuclease/exonuclease/phosphatase family protein [Rhodophyticola sp. MJ-SS7]MDU8944866.1 endonuclease/exonuclease/phosphatase family protein [Rhodophyticola sp. MJ-SS7]